MSLFSFLLVSVPLALLRMPLLASLQLLPSLPQAVLVLLPQRYDPMSGSLSRACKHDTPNANAAHTALVWRNMMATQLATAAAPKRGPSSSNPVPAVVTFLVAALFARSDGACKWSLLPLLYEVRTGGKARSRASNAQKVAPTSVSANACTQNKG